MCTLRTLQALSCSAALAALTLAAPVVAQEAAVPRTSAALPEPLSDTGEPTPPSPVAESAAAGTVAGPESGLGIGRTATEEEIAAIDIDVMPDGRGLPEGQGSFAEGKALFDERCVACHGENLEGVKETGGPALIGGRGTLASDKPVKTVESYLGQASTLYDYIHRAMPMDSPGSLSPDEVYALSAYILGRGGIVGEDAVMDAASLPKVEMPNAKGFVPDPRPGTL